MLIDTLVKNVLSELKRISNTETVVGEPIEAGGVTLIPVSRISIGFGAGGGKKNKAESGGEATGGGLSIEPVAFIVIQKDKVNLISMKKDDTGFGKIVDLIPVLAEKVKSMGKHKSDEKEDKSEKK